MTRDMPDASMVSHFLRSQLTITARRVTWSWYSQHGSWRLSRDSLRLWSAKSGEGIRRFGYSAQVKEEPAQRAGDTEQNSQAA